MSESKTIKINGKDIPFDFEGQLELHLDPYQHGVFDIIGKLNGDTERVLYEKAIVSFIDPKGKDTVGLSVIVELEGNEPYVVDCATYKRICLMSELVELKKSLS